MTCSTHTARGLLDKITRESVCFCRASITFRQLRQLFISHESEKAPMSKLKAFIPALFSLALVAAPALTPAHAAGNLVAVLEAEIVTLDPHFSTAYISRTFGYIVFDTLFAKDSNV